MPLPGFAALNPGYVLRRTDRDESGRHRRTSLTTIGSGDDLGDAVGMTRMRAHRENDVC
jgi:hypothetical protein